MVRASVRAMIHARLRWWLILSALIMCIFYSNPGSLFRRSDWKQIPRETISRVSACLSMFIYRDSIRFKDVIMTFYRFRRLHCKSNSLHINLFIAFILRAIISFIKSSLFVEGVGLEKDIQRNSVGDIEFIENAAVSVLLASWLLDGSVFLTLMYGCVSVSICF